MNMTNMTQNATDLFVTKSWAATNTWADTNTWVTNVREWPFHELPIHVLSSFLVPLAVCVVISKVFDEPFLIDEKTRKTAIKEHAWQALSGVSVWFWCCIFLNSYRQEPDMSVFETARNLLIHYLLSDAMFYWFHRACHQNLTYARIHSQHHSHKATKGAEMKMNALSGTCVDFWDMVIIGHLPVFLPCLFVSLPYAVMICYVLFCNFWISMIHSVGSRIDSAPSGVSLLGWGIFVTPRNHARHHMYGRKNVNFTVFLSLWDHAMGTYEGDDITVVKDVKEN